MLMDAGPVLDAMIELLRADPAAALCPGDFCPDCVDFKGRIRAARLAELGADVSVVLPRRPEAPDQFGELLERFGCPASFGRRSDLDIVRLEPGEKPPPPPDGGGPWVLQPAPADLVRYAALPVGYAGFAYAPLEAARAGLQPFYGVLYKQKCRDHITDIFVEDGLADLPGFGTPALGYLEALAPEGRAVLGEGHAQLREIVSALRMRTFSGRYHLVVPEGNPYAETLRLLKEFWQLLP